MAKTNGAKTNGYDEGVVKELVARIEGLHDDKASEHGAYMERCREIKADIAEVYTEAKDKHGITKKSLQAVITARMYERKAAAQRDGLTKNEDVDRFDLLRKALGDLEDTPLGQAAVQAEANDDQPQQEAAG